MRRRANRDLSLGEGVLAVAGAMRPRATPRPQKGRTQTRRTPSRHHARTARCTIRHATARCHSSIHRFIDSSIHPFVHPAIHPVIQSSSHSFIHSSIHSFTCRDKATAPQATHVHVTAYVPRRAACTVVRVCTARSLRVCACGVWALFFAQGEMTRTVGVQRSASTAPVPKEHPPRCLSHTPHAPALVPPVVDHLLCRGGVSLRSRSACAAQQGRPIPSSPEKSKKTAKEGKTLPRGPQTRSRNFSFRTSRHPQQSKLVRNMHNALRRARRTGSRVSPLQQSACRRS